MGALLFFLYSTVNMLWYTAAYGRLVTTHASHEKKKKKKKKKKYRVARKKAGGDTHVHTKSRIPPPPLHTTSTSPVSSAPVFTPYTDHHDNRPKTPYVDVDAALCTMV